MAGARRRTSARAPGPRPGASAPSRGSASGPTSSGSPSELELAGWVLNDERGVVLEVEGDAAARSSEFLAPARRRRRRRWRRSSRSSAEPVEPARRARLPDRRVASAAARPTRSVSRRHGDLRRLPRRAPRPRRPPPPLPVHQLHQLRPAVHDRPRRPLRPAADDDGRLRDVRALPRRVRGPARPPLPRPAQRLSRVRPAGPAGRPPRRDAGRPRASTATRPSRRRAAAGRARSSRSRASAATTSPASPPTSARSRRCATRKHREDKPFALMAADLDAARELVELTAAEESLLAGRERPIVIARRRAEAPGRRRGRAGLPDLGVMLPYSPLHHLLVGDVGEPLVMTSGNLSDEPIAYRDDDALERLGADRRRLPRPRSPDPHPHRRLGRALARPGLRRPPLLIRRSRGLRAREHRAAARAHARPLLGCGAELKSTFCLAKGARAWVGHHIGDLKNYETLSSFRERGRALRAAVRGRAGGRRPRPAPRLPLDPLRARARGGRAGRRPAPPRAPRRLPRRARRARAGGRRDLRRQPATGPTAPSGAARSCAATWPRYERAGLPVPGPPARRRRRRARALADGLRLAGRGARRGAPADPGGARRRRSSRAAWEAVCELAAGGLNSPLTTSAGRLFDAVAALCGAGARVSYEGQAAIELEAGGAATRARPYPMGLIDPAARRRR